MGPLVMVGSVVEKEGEMTKISNEIVSFGKTIIKTTLLALRKKRVHLEAPYGCVRSALLRSCVNVLVPL